jgi:hypothetical protein
MKFTRRELATVLAPAAALAQTSTPPNPPSGGDAEVDAARARMKANGDTLAKHAVPMDTEPAFQFRA